jgi:hypothetical protein
MELGEGLVALQAPCDPFQVLNGGCLTEKAGGFSNDWREEKKKKNSFTSQDRMRLRRKIRLR